MLYVSITVALARHDDTIELIRSSAVDEVMLGMYMSKDKRLDAGFL